MDASFVELPAFERLRTSYLDDEGYRALQLKKLLDAEREHRQPKEH